jgi:1-aminocyclopropane-1-carboxylate deaminase
VNQLVTFGGAFSNHIVAIAQAAKLARLNIVGFIRGEELHEESDKWSQTLHDASKAGMQLVFLSRKEYRLKEKSETVKRYLPYFKNFMMIPEGGSNALALLGVAEIVEELAKQIEPPTHIVTACGTGGTCAGLIDGVYKQGWDTKIIGIPVLKGAEFLVNDIENLSQHQHQINWQLYFDYHAGGYAKLENNYVSFGQQFSKKTEIPLDKIYNVKSFFATYDLIERGIIAAGSDVVILHTGGLQGGIV